MRPREPLRAPNTKTLEHQFLLPSGLRSVMASSELQHRNQKRKSMLAKDWASTFPGRADCAFHPVQRRAWVPQGDAASYPRPTAGWRVRIRRNGRDDPAET